MRFRAERANKSRSHRIRRAVHNHCPSRLAKLVQRRLQRNRRLLLNEQRNLRRRFRNRLRRHPFCYTLARPLRARPNRCPASCCTACPCRSHRFRSSFAVCLSRECSPSSALKTSISQVCKYNFLTSGPVSTGPETLKPFTSGARQCACRCVCYAGSSYPTSGRPRAFAGGCP